MPRSRLSSSAAALALLATAVAAQVEEEVGGYLGGDLLEALEGHVLATGAPVGTFEAAAVE